VNIFKKVADGGGTDKNSSSALEAWKMQEPHMSVNARNS
jgi:hypothetical protein